MNKILSSIQDRYFNYFFAAACICLLLRVVETVHVYLRFKPDQLLISEFIGYIIDLFQIGIVLALFSPFLELLIRRFPVTGIKLGWYFIGLFVLLHISISEYFFYQLRPLDVFVFKHKSEEMAFSINTADTQVLWPAMLKYSLLLLSFFIIAIRFYNFKASIAIKKLSIYGYLLLSIVFVPYFSLAELPLSRNLAVNKSTFLYINILKELKRYALGYKLEEKAQKFQEEFPGKEYVDPAFPFLHRFKADDRLSRYLDSSHTPPNLVLIIVEGLSNEYIKPMSGMNFMPFLDSLSEKSLYWDHMLSNSERSFGATPSLNGSLPFANTGFSMLEKYPKHFSLVNVLRENEFFTRFFYGQGAWFHGKEPFYKFNNIHQIIDKEMYHADLEKVFVGNEKHFWGYNDFDLFKQYFYSTDTLKSKLRYDVFFTGTSHAPFALKYPEKYHHRFQDQFNKLSNDEDRKHYETYKKYYKSLFNVDDALKYFIESFSVRPEYHNTIFIITGDHPITEIPAKNQIKKYHVPLILFSTMVNTPTIFHEVASHLDLYETLMSYYQQFPNIKIPEYSTALGRGLKFSRVYDDQTVIPLMTDNRRIDDFFFNGFFISEQNRLYKVKPGFILQEYFDQKNFYKIKSKMEVYESASISTCQNDGLLPVKYYDEFFNYETIAHIDYNEPSTLSTGDLSILKGIKIENELYFLDLNIDHWNLMDLQSECIIRIYDKLTNKTIKSIVAEKNSSSVTQFHLSFHPQIKNSRNQILCDVELLNKNANVGVLSKINARIYKKKSNTFPAY